ncbi:MAG: exodeoxyribonuclease VII small subunit [Candidatus Treponema excrementipullorum]|uniref:Exodeoxyribonuclease 7 small subunit n=1 Tax=Candidatus Treponema excrementipullorum TaxID=2838768 RepID=A0A9E2NYH4_9SPIR|nr:exodeoxyribonuclease VII small subunit [Candidatus Treponema excrementipullorum]MCI6478842.1 exodeoxyribonuclease VII small subunit [Spirochaetia bacterium]MDD7011353.1 exodeoxyribonuclease VII small subunit [Candidatus Treponema excrementipullorum]MDY4466876.1 exodeoxyribonuclease VII small subunit [Candidatus Treponema excrementipullorum]MDY4708410.1 exodeoxyribonuclease VII small subunit [Candidatus Treponema excrementipullorum]
MKNFEEKLERLEKISSDIKKSDVTLEEALKYFEEGITLARTMEKELDKIEGKIQILMNQPEVDSKDTSRQTPELDLFSGVEV